MLGLLAAWGLSLLVLCRLLVAVASLVVVHRLTYPVAGGLFLDQGSNPCTLHWQEDS